MWTKLFWKDALERAIRTVAQALLGILAANGTSVANMDANATFVILIVSFVGSIATSLAGSGAKNSVSPASLVK